jgi:dephospho-CoA kinase
MNGEARTSFAIALTGGVASGKTAVARRFAALGVPLIDADVVAHALVQPGEPALAEIANTFGSAVLDGSRGFDRKSMRERVFVDTGARKKLEAILHPRIHAAIVEQTEHVRAPYCVLAIPLFVETHDDYSWVDRVLLTDVPENIQVERLASRPGIGETLAKQILVAQAPRNRRLAIANDVIDNTAPLANLELVVARLHQRYSRLAAIRLSKIR